VDVSLTCVIDAIRDRRNFAENIEVCFKLIFDSKFEKTVTTVF